VDAYLNVYPSSLPDTIADTVEHYTQWVRDETRRILEYAARDLGFARIVLTDTTRAVSREFWRDQVIHWLTDFADLRQRFYGFGDAAALKQELMQAQLNDIDPKTQKLDLEKYLDRLEAKLTEFQGWWAAHQNDPVQLPTPEAAPATSPSPAPTP
jgi:non-homologous end joining protein Ku